MSGYNQVAMALEKRLSELKREYENNDRQLQATFESLSEALKDANKEIEYLKEKVKELQ
jgi:flagellar capping protein FliD